MVCTLSPRFQFHLPDLTGITTHIHSKLNKKADLLHAIIARDNSADFKIINRVPAEHLFQTVNVLPQANFCFKFPSLKATSVKFSARFGGKLKDGSLYVGWESFVEGQPS